MKFILNLSGTNNGGKFLETYAEQQVEINSLYKDIDVNSPPLAILKTSDNKQHSIQLIDIRFINNDIYIQCFAIPEDNSKGGKALLKLTPIV